MLWDRVDILRIAFVQSKSGDLLQVIPRDVPISLEKHKVEQEGTLDDLAGLVFEESLQPRLEMGATYVKFMLIHGPGKSTRFGFRVSHGHFDGVSLIPILSCLAASLQDRDWPNIQSSLATLAMSRSRTQRPWIIGRKILRGRSPWL